MDRDDQKKDPKDSAFLGGVGGEELFSIALATLGLRTGWANKTLSISEYQIVPSLVMEFTNISREEAIYATRAASTKVHSEEFFRISLEAILLALSPQEFNRLVYRLLDILAIDGQVCDQEVNFLFQLYLDVEEAAAELMEFHGYDANEFIDSLGEILVLVGRRSSFA